MSGGECPCVGEPGLRRCGLDDSGGAEDHDRVGDAVPAQQQLGLQIVEFEAWPARFGAVEKVDVRIRLPIGGAGEQRGDAPRGLRIFLQGFGAFVGKRFPAARRRRRFISVGGLIFRSHGSAFFISVAAKGIDGANAEWRI